MIELVKAIEAKALEGYRLWLRFSDGREGVRDMSDILAAGGSMVEPVRDPAMFARVFIQCGVPTWPNGFDLDAIALHDDMARAGLLSAPRAA
jgi:hypothetical protein